MTYAAVELNVMTGKMQLSQVQFQLMQVSNARLSLSYQMAQYVGEDFNESPVVARIQALDQTFELKQQQLETQNSAIQADVEAWKKLLDQNVKKDHSVSLAG